ncbi:MAG: hypothetical protein IPJ32_21720 [Sphingobacteriaceae bacterium]|nr:hypothetical protein [Sphingobacteriaceae bacterium]
MLKNNFIQDLISQGASSLQQEFNEGKLVLVGVNKYENKGESSKYKNAMPDEVSKKEIAPIKPIRLAYSVENKKTVTAN